MMWGLRYFLIFVGSLQGGRYLGNPESSQRRSFYRCYRHSAFSVPNYPMDGLWGYSLLLEEAPRYRHEIGKSSFISKFRFAGDQPWAKSIAPRRCHRP